MEKLTTGWVQHLRKAHRRETTPNSHHCPLCGAEVQPNLDKFKAHVQANSERHHMLQDSDVEEIFNKAILQDTGPNGNSGSSAQPVQSTGIGSATARKRLVTANADTAKIAKNEQDRVNLVSDGTESSHRGSKKLWPPPASITQQRGSSPPRPSRSRVRASDTTDEFERGPYGKNSPTRQLWTPADDGRSFHASQRPKSPFMRYERVVQTRRSPNQRSRRGHRRAAKAKPHSKTASTMKMIRQPDTRPILPGQLVAEAEGVYAGLILLESKCIDQHPSASDGLRQLASKYAMPARIYHSIHSFLELLRHKLPKSLEHMLTFIYIAYSFMALLYETVPVFKETWIEYLADLGTYGMAIEDNDSRDHETWADVSRYWYTKASGNAPTTGRLHHQLAVLARPNVLQQLYFYAKSLCVSIPFPTARHSVMTLFDPLLSSKSAPDQKPEPVDAAFVRVHGILFSGKATDHLSSSMKQFFDLLDSRIGREHRDWLESGYHVGISLSCLLLGYGNESNVLMDSISGQAGDGEDDTPMNGTNSEPSSTFENAVSFAEKTYQIVIERWGDKNTLPCIHTTLVFYLFMTQRPAAMKYLEDKFPWKLTSVLLNYLLRTCDLTLRIDTTDFPGPEKKEAPRPLPEDYAMRGLVYTEHYFPREWFDNDRIDDDERYFEPASNANKRRERILWIGRMIARQGKWLVWDATTRQFTVTAKYDVEIENMPVAPLPQSDNTAAPVKAEDA